MRSYQLGTNNMLVTLLLLCTTLSSCGANELNKKAEATAVEFYKQVQQKNYDAAINLCSAKAFTHDDKDKWKLGLQRTAALMGDIKSYTKTTGFNIETSTSRGTTVTLAYDVLFQYGKSKDSIVLVKEKDGSMKIYYYGWDHSDAEYLKQISASEKNAVQYMNAIKEGNFDAAIGMISETAFNITSKDGWKTFYDKVTGKYGAVSNYDILSDSSYYHVQSKGDSGFGNYYDIFVKTNRNGNDVMEKVVFFQKDYTEPAKLVGHFFL